MLSIIWSILKIIGIIILILLGILLAILLLVLFVPLRYAASVRGSLGASGDGEDAAGEDPKAADYLVQARISWLFRLLCVRVQVEPSGAFVRVKILGIPFLGKKNKNGQTNKKTDTAYGAAEGKRKRPEKESKKESGKEPGEESNPENAFEEAPIQVPMPDEVSDSQNKAPVVAERKGKEGLWSRIRQFFFSINEKRKRLLIRIRAAFSGIAEKLKKIAGMAGEIREFLADEKNKAEIRFLFEQGKRLLLQILPRRLSGTVSFSLEDPAATGQVLIVLSMVYPLFQDSVTVTPLFENRTYIGGAVSLKGRIRVFSLLIIVLKVWLNKEFRAFLKRGQKLKENLG